MFEHWKDHFHPHEGNDHQPHAYRAAGAIALGLVAISIVAVTTIQLNFITHSEHFLSAVLPSVLVDLTNEDRQEEGLHALKRNKTLDRAAQMKADHMAELGYFAHDGPNGTTPWEWFADAGYQYKTAGENLAINFSDSVDVEKAWMESQLHRENILEEDFTEIGIATAKGEYEGEETIFVVQLFGTPSEAELAGRSDDTLAQAEDTDDEPEDVSTSDDTETTESETETETTSQPDEPTEETADTQTTDTTIQDNQLAQTNADQSEETTSPTPTPEPEPTTSTSGETAPAQSDEEPPTTSPETSNTQMGQAATPTPITTFATPTPIAQVQGESGIALQTSGSTISQQASRLAHFLSRPEFLFKTLMLTLFALVALSLLVSVGVEAKRHHVDQASKALGALVLLLAIFYFGMMYLFPETEVIPQSDSRLSADKTSLVDPTPSL